MMCRCQGRRIASERGVALILVMLSLFILTVLATSIVFSARSETFASFNYRIATQADYVAKAGLQKSINFFNSDKYKSVPPTSAMATYAVTPYVTSPLTLYSSLQNPVQCIADCPTTNGAVELALNSSGSFSGNFPTTITNPDSETIPTAFTSRFYNVALNPLSSATNSGQFTLSAKLMEYYTVNDDYYPRVNAKAYEVWHVVSTGTWNTNLGAGTRKTTSIQEATLAPVYLPYFANALYGMCNLTLNGTVCTDSYDSRNGTYNGSTASNCVNGGSTGTNAFASGSGVGAGGNVTMNGSSYTVNGNVSYGAAAPSYSSTWGCPTATSGVTGSVAGVTGAVQPVPAIPEPPMPTFPDCTWYSSTSTTACSTAPPPNPLSLGNNEYAWVKNIAGLWYLEHKTLVGHTVTITTYLLTGAAGLGTAASPYNLPALAFGNGADVCLAGGAGASSAIYYNIRDVSQAGTGRMYVVNGSAPPAACPPAVGYSGIGYTVLNIYQELNLGGQGVVQYGAPPTSLVINVYNEGSNDTTDTSVNLSGQANLTAMVTALGGATLGGGGSGGAFYGAVLAGAVTDSGTYSVHYDMSLQVASGKLKPMAIRNYTRPKY